MLVFVLYTINLTIYGDLVITSRIILKLIYILHIDLNISNDWINAI